MNTRLLIAASCLFSSFAACAYDISTITPGMDITGMKIDGYETNLHAHPSEGLQPCIVLTNSTNEIHALLSQHKKVVAVYIKKGSFSPVSIKIGDTLSKLKATFPTGKLLRYDSELIDPVSFRVNVSGKKFAFTVEWESTFNVLGGKWETFDAEKVPGNAKVLEILWE